MWDLLSFWTKVFLLRVVQMNVVWLCFPTAACVQLRCHRNICPCLNATFMRARFSLEVTRGHGYLVRQCSSWRGMNVVSLYVTVCAGWSCIDYIAWSGNVSSHIDSLAVKVSYVPLKWVAHIMTLCLPEGDMQLRGKYYFYSVFECIVTLILRPNVYYTIFPRIELYG